jgi:hypothetical protein
MSLLNSPLAIRESKAPTSELLPERTILLDGILDDVLVHPTGNGNDLKSKMNSEPAFIGAAYHGEAHLPRGRTAPDMNRVFQTLRHQPCAFHKLLTKRKYRVSRVNENSVAGPKGPTKKLIEV